MHKVVINDCYGGFGLSPIAVKRFYELKGIPIYFYTYDRSTLYGKDHRLRECKYIKVNPEDLEGRDPFIVVTKDLGASFMRPYNSSIKEITWCEPERTDPILIQVVEELGEKANSSFSHLKIDEFSGNKYRICEYDGLEYIETPDSIHWKTI